MRRQASAGRNRRAATGAPRTGNSLGANFFRLCLRLGAVGLGRPVTRRDLARLSLPSLVALARLAPIRPSRGVRRTGPRVPTFSACLRIGLAIGLRIGLGLFCLGLGLGVGLGVCVWLIGRLLVGLVLLGFQLAGHLATRIDAMRLHRQAGFSR